MNMYCVTGEISQSTYRFGDTFRFNPTLENQWFTSVMRIINNVAMLSIILTGAALIVSVSMAPLNI